MENWARDLIIATAGAVLGAAVVYVLAFGVRWTRKSREDARRMRAIENSEWEKSDLLGRQQFANTYLFDVLKFFIIGSCVTTAGSLFTDFQLYQYSAPFGVVGLLFLLRALARLTRYMRLSRSFYFLMRPS